MKDLSRWFEVCVAELAPARTRFGLRVLPNDNHSGIASEVRLVNAGHSVVVIADWRDNILDAYLARLNPSSELPPSLLATASAQHDPSSYSLSELVRQGGGSDRDSIWGIRRNAPHLWPDRCRRLNDALVRFGGPVLTV